MKKKVTIRERLKQLKNSGYHFVHYHLGENEELIYEFVKKSNTGLFDDTFTIMVNIYAHSAMNIWLRQYGFVQ